MPSESAPSRARPLLPSIAMGGLKAAGAARPAGRAEPVSKARRQPAEWNATLAAAGSITELKTTRRLRGIGVSGAFGTL